MIKEAWHGGMPMSSQGYIIQDYSYYILILCEHGKCLVEVDLEQKYLNVQPLTVLDGNSGHKLFCMLGNPHH